MESKMNASSNIISTESDSSYALYLFSNNKHAISSNTDTSISEKGSLNSFQKEIEEPNVCLSLLEGNLNAEQETVVRCYLLNALSLREDLSFNNEGKYAVLHFSDETSGEFGCYYHRLCKVSEPKRIEESEENIPKSHTFFVCLIGPANGAMESFCPELSSFCCSLLDLLDPQGIKNKEDVQLKLKSWYIYCIEYVGRCIKNFQDDVALIFLCSLWGNVVVEIENKDMKWDLERFIDTCSLMANNMTMQSELVSNSKEDSSILKLKEKDGKLLIEGKCAESSSYCTKWFEKLNSCSPDDHKSMHGILEGFRLKTVQDLNNLKRLLQKSVNDHYSLYKAFLFLQASGYEDILLYHVEKEVSVAGEVGVADVISCLREFIFEQHSES